MIEFVCGVNFILAYTAYYFFKKKKGYVSVIMFALGWIFFVSGLLLTRMILES
jgi:predicted Na+-dependent transporter